MLTTTPGRPSEVEIISVLHKIVQLITMLIKCNGPPARRNGHVASGNGYLDWDVTQPDHRDPCTGLFFLSYRDVFR